MISPISIATRGRISNSTKKTLTFAVIGWLVFANNEPMAPRYIDGYKEEVVESSGANTQRRNRIIENDDDEVLSIIKMWLKCR